MIKNNLQKVKERISAVCSNAGRDHDSITIVCVSKGRSLEQIKEAIEAGITDIGENRTQEAAVKYKELSAIGNRLPVIKWHMLGHLQTNKARETVKIFDLIQSVDSLHLAEAVNKEALKLNKLQDILIEVKTSPEASKSGLKPEEAAGAIREIVKLTNLKLKGLMTIAPLVDNPQKARPYFRQLRDLRNKIYELGIVTYGQLILSMGMSDDFEVAIEEGADMVRLGRVVFDEK